MFRNNEENNLSGRTKFHLRSNYINYMYTQHISCAYGPLALPLFQTDHRSGHIIMTHIWMIS